MRLVRVAAFTAACAVGIGGLACGGDREPASSPTATTASSTRPALRSTATPEPEGTRTDGALESPESALRRRVALLDAGDYGAAWDELHPAQQAIVERERYIACLAPMDFALSVDIIETQDAVIEAPEIAQVPAKSIIVRLTSQSQVLDRQFFEVLVDGRWRWVMEQPQIDAYRAGVCP
jgi:hypothetical protein